MAKAIVLINTNIALTVTHRRRYFCVYLVPKNPLNTLQIKKDLQKVKKNGEIFGKFKKGLYLCIVVGEILTQ